MSIVDGDNALYSLCFMYNWHSLWSTPFLDCSYVVLAASRPNPDDVIDGASRRSLVNTILFFLLLQLYAVLSCCLSS